MIRFGQDVCGDLDAALRHEWLETNGLGGFASSTIVGLNTRRYHGLLVAATQPPVGRYVLLSKLEETLLLDGVAFDLSANRYPSVVHPQGFRYLKQFRLDPFPIFTYEIDGVEIEKTVFMVQGENSTIVQYRLGNKSGSKSLAQKIELELRPLIAFRDYHGTTHENATLNYTLESGRGLASITPYPGHLPCISRTTPGNLEAAAIGIATSNMMPSANVALSSLRISSIPSSCTLICVRAPMRRSSPQRSGTMPQRQADIVKPKSPDDFRTSGALLWKTISSKPLLPPQISSSSREANRRPSLPVITGSATGAETL